MTPSAGMRLGPYGIRSPLGACSMGEVQRFLICDLRLDVLRCDGKSHAYAYRRMASHLFLAEGAR